MPRPKLPDGSYVDQSPVCLVCGDPILWLYDHYGRLKGYDPESFEDDSRKTIQHYPGCPNLTKAVKMPLVMKEHIERYEEARKEV